MLTAQGTAGVDALGFAVDGMDKTPPSARVAYRCLDWSERRDHMAGQLPKALLAHCLQQGWLRRYDGERAKGNAAGAQAPGGVVAFGE